MNIWVITAIIVASIIGGIVLLAVTTNVSVQRSERRRSVHARKVTIVLNEKCALAYNLCKDKKQVPDSLIKEVEELLEESIDDSLIFYEDECPEQGSINALVEHLNETSMSELSADQAYRIGRLHSMLKIYKMM